MFEKEAEENKPPYACCSFNTGCELWKDGFQKGADFGYNKANEWHFVKDELPNNTNICLLYLGSWYNPTTGWYDNKAWCFEDDRKSHLWQDAVIAWKEIIPPEEMEENA